MTTRYIGIVESDFRYCKLGRYQVCGEREGEGLEWSAVCILTRRNIPGFKKGALGMRRSRRSTSNFLTSRSIDEGPKTNLQPRT